MIAYATRALGAQLRGGRVLFLLAVAGVALGVASVLSIQILNRSAVGAFAGGIRAISGDAQLSILGRGPTLPDALLPAVLGEAGVRAAIPVVRVDVALDGGGTLEVVGADLFAPLRVPWELPRGEPGDVLTRRGWVAIGPQLASRTGWQRGARVAVSSGSRRVELEVGAVVDFRKVAPLASARLAVMDLAQAQALLGAPGRVTQIDVLAAPGVDVAALARRLEARLGPGVRVATPEQRVTEADALLAAFRLNLTALSLVSLLVGGFVVHASTQAALARRREEMGTLRCVGATRGQVVALVLGDAALLGALGTAAGIPIGWVAARANVGAVSATVRTLYLLEGIEQVTLTPALIALAAGVGLAGAVGGALAPALDVAREDPRALLSRRADPGPRGGNARRLAAAGGLLVALAAAVALGPARGWRYAGFALALAVLVAVPLGAPLLLGLAGRLPAPRRIGVRHGARDLAAHLRSTAVAAGALGVAVSMLAGITVMVGSFRRTVEDWLSATLRADVYVTTPAWRRGGRSEASIAPRVVAALARAPGVRAVDRLRQLQGEVAGARVSISGFDAGSGEPGRVQLLAPAGRAAEGALRRVARDGAVLVSEPLARKRAVRVGDDVAIAGPRGPVRLPVAGIYRDYGAEQGAVMMDLTTLDAVFGPGPLTHVALHLAPQQDVDRAVERLRAEWAGEALLIRSNRRLRDDVLAVFEQTFAVTRLLQAMSLLVAVCGVALSLLVLARERSGEVALYRALGAVRSQVLRLFVGRALGIALAGLALGAAGGGALALVLVEMVNPAWFGWSIALHPPWRALGEQALLLLVAALAASAYPAVRASRTPATELSRDAL